MEYLSQYELISPIPIRIMVHNTKVGGIENYQEGPHILSKFNQTSSSDVTNWLKKIQIINYFQGALVTIWDFMH